MKRILPMLILLSACITSQAQKTKTITFKSTDEVVITADLYTPHSEETTFILLFHQAGWSRGEYVETAPKLNKLGYNCMAIDQRSGDEINSVVNQTKLSAEKFGKETRFVDAYDDLISSIKYVKAKFPKAKLIVWGSSYSSGLSLHICGEYPEIANGVIAFSPGEYYTNQGKSETFVEEGARKINIPVFITSAKGEEQRYEGIFNAIPTAKKHSFVPKSDGQHGSRALWSKFEDSGAYWIALKNFLRINF